LGGNTVLYGSLPGGEPLVVQLVGQSPVRRGETVHALLPAATCHLFDHTGAAILA
jgi:multiple sugar transport system ATP-binding protein